LPVDYRVDRNHGISDPRGMSAERLGARLLAVSVSRSSLDNIIDAIDKCHLTIRGVMVGGLASHYSVVTEEEMQLGACLVEIGASVSTLVVFNGGGAVHLETLPIGSDHLTRDIAEMLNCNIAAAERIKTLHGSALSNPSDNEREIRLPQEAMNGGLLGSDRITKSFVVSYMQPRIDEMLTMIKRRIEHPNIRKFAGRRVIFTGGGANLTGLRDYATLALDRQIRIGRPREMQGLSASRTGYELSAALGLAHFTATAGTKAAHTSLGSAPLSQKSLLQSIPLVGGLFSKRAA
jgi:cell division protein FtsA